MNRFYGYVFDINIWFNMFRHHQWIAFNDASCRSWTRKVSRIICWNEISMQTKVGIHWHRFDSVLVEVMTWSVCLKSFVLRGKGVQWTEYMNAWRFCISSFEMLYFDISVKWKSLWITLNKWTQQEKEFSELC